MIVYDARDNADRPQPKNHVEFKGDNLWENPGAPMVQLQLNMDTVKAHLELSDANNVPALFNTTLKVIDLKRWQKYIDAVKACKPDGLILWDYSGHGPWSEVEDHFNVN